jgi:glutathionyl-hydroquinone reductase
LGTAIVRTLKGLENIISLSAVHYLMGPNGWHFEDDTPGCIPDFVNNAKFIREVYLKADPDYNARFTVPVLWDKKLNTIVNNESSEIIRMLNSEFDQWSSSPGLTFYPENLKGDIDTINSWIYDHINNGVYKTGFATKQQVYEENCKSVFEHLDNVEGILAKNEFLVGGQFTEADIRLFTTILRFDPVYHTHFRLTSKTITHDYPSILRWTRQIYQMSGVAGTINMEHIKKHYYMSHTQINPLQIVPLWNGPDLTAKI